MPSDQSDYPDVKVDELKVLSTTASTTSTTGAIVCDGGVGIAGDLNVGGSITGGSISYASTSTGTLAVTNTPGTTLTVASTEPSLSSSTGAAVFQGGVGIIGDLNVGGSITGGSISYASTSTGTLSVTNGTGQTTTILSTQASTTPSTGAVRVDGGVGVAGNVTAGGKLQTTATGADSINTAGGIQCAGVVYAQQEMTATRYNLSYGECLYVTEAYPHRKILNADYDNPLSQDTTYLYTPGTSGSTASSTYVLGVNKLGMKIPAVTASNSPTTGAITTVGGVGVGQNLNVAGVLGILDTTQSTNSTTGCAVFEGGVAVKKNLNAAGNITCTGFTASTGNINTFSTTALTVNTLQVTATTPSTSKTTGAVRSSGGVGINGAVWCATANSEKAVISGGVSKEGLQLKSDATEENTIALYNNSSAKNWEMGINVNNVLSNHFSMSDGTTRWLDIERLNGKTSVNSTSTGIANEALRVGGDVFSGATLRGTTLAVTTANATVVNATNVVASGAVSAATLSATTVSATDITAAGNTTVSGRLLAQNTAETTGAGTGSFETLGGLRVEKNASIGGKVLVDNTDNATGAATGSIQTNGGIYAAKDIVCAKITAPVGDITSLTVTNLNNAQFQYIDRDMPMYIYSLEVTSGGSSPVPTYTGFTATCRLTVIGRMVQLCFNISVDCTAFPAFPSSTLYTPIFVPRDWKYPPLYGDGKVEVLCGHPSFYAQSNAELSNPFYNGNRCGLRVYDFGHGFEAGLYFRSKTLQTIGTTPDFYQILTDTGVAKNMLIKAEISYTTDMPFSFVNVTR